MKGNVLKGCGSGTVGRLLRCKVQQRSTWERAVLRRPECKPGAVTGRLFPDVEAGLHPAEDTVSVLLFPYNIVLCGNTHSVHRAPSGL